MTEFAEMRTYKIVAHRGASAYEPENTIRAIKRAIELGADMVEVDAHSTSDSELVVIHDPTVDRTTNGKGVVKQMTLQEIRRLDAGKDERIPTLREVLELSRNKIEVMIEAKGIGIEKLLVELLEAEDLLHHIVVTSFMTDAIRKTKELNSKISIGQIFSWKIPNMAQKALELRVSCMVPQYELVTKEMVKELHERRIALFAWTVNNRRVSERLIELGVDGIVTNKPDLMSAAKRAGK
jgi:glycerophosphoryl diester phosphodiesterase